MPHFFNGDTNIESIYLKCINRTATSEERKQFIEWIRRPENEKAANELILSDLDKDVWEEHGDGQISEQIIQSILWLDKQKAPQDFIADSRSAGNTSPGDTTPVVDIQRVPLLKRSWLRYAAILLLIAGTAIYLYRNNRTQEEMLTQAKHEAKANADIQPGGNKALLTLSDGRTIVLDSASVGSLTQQGNTMIIKLSDGALAYNAERQTNPGAVEMYNTITTPKGGQYQITLPDGSNVWLNAASSIRFPAQFVGTERKVQITGEAYFEIAKNKAQPFRVNVANQAVVEVLGTHFNVSAYDNENAINTTLLEGIVKIVHGTQNAILKPGQQAQIKQSAMAGSSDRLSAGSHTAIAVSNSVDTKKVMAWKNGFFSFEELPFDEAMRQLERWYDIEVVYEKGIPDIQFEGKMTRDIPLSGLLIALERSDVHFRVEGRKLIVMP